jgi:hypothetical protein
MGSKIMFMSVLRVVIAFCALAVLATIAFGQEITSPDYYDPELLELERALEAEIAEDAMQSNRETIYEDEMLMENTTSKFKEDASPNSMPTSTPSHIDLTGEPLNQPLSKTRTMDADGIIVQETATTTGNTEYVSPMNDSYFAPLTGMTEVAEVTRLSSSPVNLESFGVITPQTGGFEQNLWQNISNERAINLLKRVQEHGVKSQSVKLLLQRALITKATAPAGSNIQNNWLAERIKTLHALGYAEAAYLLLKDFKSEWLKDYPNMAPVWVETLLMTGDPDTACNFSKQHILNENTTFWRQTLLVCQAIERDVRGLQLSLELAPSEDKTANPLLYRLLNALLSKEETPRLKPEQVFSPLHAVMYSYYPHLMTPDALIRLPDMLLRRIVENKELSETKRIQAAEKLVNDFAVAEDIQALISLYTQVEFSEKQLENPLGAAEKIADGSLARALIWQGTNLTQLASAKALMIKKLWERASNDGLENISAMLTPKTVNIYAHPNLAWFAPIAVESYLKAGQQAQAQNWWKIITDTKKPSKELVEAKQKLSVTLSLISGDVPTQDLNSWVKNKPLDSQKDVVEIQRILSTLEASNITIPSSIWLSLHSNVNDSNIEQGVGPGQLWLRVLGSSLESGNIGEALLIISEPLMYQKPDNMMPQAIANIITSLRFLTLPQDANKLALEVLLNKG